MVTKHYLNILNGIEYFFLLKHIFLSLAKIYKALHVKIGLDGKEKKII